MIFIDQGEEGGWQDGFFSGGGFLSEGVFGQRGVLAGGGGFARGGFWPERGFGQRGVLAGGGFWPEGDFGRRGGFGRRGFWPEGGFGRRRGFVRLHIVSRGETIWKLKYCEINSLKKKVNLNILNFSILN